MIELSGAFVCVRAAFIPPDLGAVKRRPYTADISTRGPRALAAALAANPWIEAPSKR